MITGGQQPTQITAIPIPGPELMRSVRFERLESRELLASDIALYESNFDVTGDGFIDSADALQIRDLLRGAGSIVKANSPADVNDDGIVSSIDSLQVINASSRFKDQVIQWIITIDDSDLNDLDPTELDLEIDERLRSRFDRGVEVSHVFRAAFNGFIATLTGEEATQLRAESWIKTIEPDFTVQPQSDSGPSWIGADQLWSGIPAANLPGTQGEGVVIGIIDGGVDYDHSSFAAIGPKDGYQHLNPLGAGQFLGMCDPASSQFDSRVTCNDKLIGLYNFTADSPLNVDSHPTHVASTAAGNAVDVTFAGVSQTLTISGVAPHANLISYDVCASGFCATSDVLRAIDQAILDDVDVINMSLGGFPFTTTNLALRGAREAGIFVAVSAGNSGPNPSTLSNPSVSPWLTSVANTSHDRSFSRLLEIVAPAPPPPISEFQFAPGENVEITADIGPLPIVDALSIDPSNHEGCAPFASGIFNNAIAMVDRGTNCFFADRVSNALAAGASAVLVANNTEGVITMGNVGLQIPSIMVSQSDGNQIRNWLATQSGALFTIHADLEVIHDEQNADIVRTSSSRGPNLSFDILTPAIAAPGTHILAAVAGAAGDEFGFKTGTSMASPHIAGAIALIKSLRPTWTPAELQSAIMLTSLAPESLRKEDGTTPADAFDVGAGRIVLEDAVLSGLVMDESDANFQSLTTISSSRGLNLPGLVNSQLSGRYTWSRTVRNALDVTETWNAAPQSATGVDLIVEPASFTLAPGESQQIDVTFDLSDAPADPSDWLFGHAVLEPLNAAVPDARLPMATHFPPFALQVVIAERSVTEGQGTFAARVFHTGNTTTAVTVALGLNDPSLGSIPSNVTIPGGSSHSDWFTVTLNDDQVPELDQTLQVTATSPGWTSASDDVVIIDDDRAIVSQFIVGQGETQRSVVDRVSLEFDSLVTVDESAGPAFVVENIATGQQVSYSMQTEDLSGQTLVTLSFLPGDSVESRGTSSPTLANGSYRLSIVSDRVTHGGVPIAGDLEFTDGFFRKFGDVNGTDLVELLDFADLRSEFGKNDTAPDFPDHWDSDGDGVIGLLDFAEFRSVFGT